MLFRIVQEALTNVLRHAEARAVSVQVARRGDKLLVLVHDDGKGIDGERMLNGESWGIRGMLERARHFQGEVRITDNGGQGTTLSLELPLGQWNDDAEN